MSEETYERILLACLLSFLVNLHTPRTREVSALTAMVSARETRLVVVMSTKDLGFRVRAEGSRHLDFS